MFEGYIEIILILLDVLIIDNIKNIKNGHLKNNYLVNLYLILISHFMDFNQFLSFIIMRDYFLFALSIFKFRGHLTF